MTDLTERAARNIGREVRAAEAAKDEKRVTALIDDFEARVLREPMAKQRALLGAYMDGRFG